MNDKLKTPEMDALFRAVLQLKTTGECAAFFSDLCTVKELLEMALRLRTAVLLREGKTYAEIGALTGVSTATVSRVNHELQYGSDGYNLVLDRLKSEC